MLRQVFHDLQAFMLFFVIMLWILSLIFNIIEVGEYEGGHEKELLSFLEDPGYPGIENKWLPRWTRQFVKVLRISLGDFDFSESCYLNPFENYIYWAVWFLLVLLTCIIFLNFIVAEVSASYNKVNECVKGLVEQERAQLIKESEDMMLQRWKNDPKKFPKYLIRREIEE